MTKALKSVFVDTKLRSLADAPIRFVLSRFFDRVMAYPQLNEPMSGKLRAYDRNVFLPGADDIPNDFVMLLKTNSRFVESFLVGLNYEMCRELAVARISDRPTRHAVPLFLGPHRRQARHRTDPSVESALRLGLQHTAPPLSEQPAAGSCF